MAHIRFPQNAGEVCLHNLFDLSSGCCDGCTIEKLPNLDPVTLTDADGHDSILTVQKKLTPHERLAARSVLQRLQSPNVPQGIDSELGKIPD